MRHGCVSASPMLTPVLDGRARYAWGATSWRRGGVATQRPAKPSTPVRLRSSPSKSPANEPLFVSVRWVGGFLWGGELMRRELPGEVTQSAFGPRFRRTSRPSRLATVSLAGMWWSSASRSSARGSARERVDAILARASDALAEPRADLLDALRGADAVNMDETGWRLALAQMDRELASMVRLASSRAKTIDQRPARSHLVRAIVSMAWKGTPLLPREQACLGHSRMVVRGCIQTVLGVVCAGLECDASAACGDDEHVAVGDSL
jgi:hypothetical protein